MTGLHVSESELHALLVTELEAVEPAEFDKARLMADRLKIPLERALAERGRFPFGFLLEHLAQAWKVVMFGLGFFYLVVAFGLGAAVSKLRPA